MMSRQQNSVMQFPRVGDVLSNLEKDKIEIYVGG